jgi:YaiO family outer membrane protein
VGVIVAAGREATSLAGLVTLTSQRSAVLVGRHWLRQNLAITYSAGHTREGDFYNRNGFSLGLQSVF